MHTFGWCVSLQLFACSLLAGEVSKTPLVVNKGGTPEQPVVFDGKGMIIDLGIDVTDQDWKKEGDLWTSSGPIMGRKLIVGGQLAGLFLDEIPLSIPRDLGAEQMHPEKKGFCYFPPAALKPGQMGYSENEGGWS